MKPEDKLFILIYCFQLYPRHLHCSR